MAVKPDLRVPPPEPSAERRRQLAELADWHREWVTGKLRATVPFRPRGASSDYNLHHVDIDADDDEFHRRAREALGLVDRATHPSLIRAAGGDHWQHQLRDPAGRWVGDVRRLLDDLPEGPDIHYHGTRTGIDTYRGELFITESKNAALGYLEGGWGKVYAVRLHPGVRVAREDEILAAADHVFGDRVEHFGYQPYTFELADDSAVRSRLAEQGFAAAEFVDLGPDNAYEHPTIVLWDRSALDVEASVDVPEHDRATFTTAAETG